MNCHKIREELLNILLFSPHPTLSPPLHSHLKECSPCREWWEKENKLEEWLQANLRIYPVFLKVPFRVRKREIASLLLIYNLLGIYYVGFLALCVLFFPFITFFFHLLISLPIFPSWWATTQYLLLLIVSLWIVTFCSLILNKKYIFAGVKL
ncbi:MAG: hypothetical protein V2G48_03500 [bacterium JZ-2024 1]